MRGRSHGGGRVRHFLLAHHGGLDLDTDSVLSECGQCTTVKCTQGRMDIGTQLRCMFDVNGAVLLYVIPLAKYNQSRIMTSQRPDSGLNIILQQRKLVTSDKSWYFEVKTTRQIVV